MARVTNKKSIKERIWLWGQPAGCYHKHWPNLPGRSVCTPAEAARILGIDNLIYVSNRKQAYSSRVREDRDAVFARKLVWSVIDGSTKDKSKACAKVKSVAALTDRFKALEGGIMDDFFVRNSKDGRIARVPVEAVRSYRETLHSARRPLDLWGVLYMRDLVLPKKKMREYLDEIDVVTFWIWHARNLARLEKSLEKVWDICGRRKRLVLGCYLWDFGNDAPIGKDLMAHQLDVALKGLRNGGLEGMILLGSPIADLPLDSIKYTRAWLKKHAGVR